MIDLHVHTTNSDGKYSVLQLLQMAEEKSINTISFCDHNILGAYKELQNINNPFSGKIITGIEFDFVFDKKNFHMLGYNFDVNILSKSKYIDRRTISELLQIEYEHLDFFKSVCNKLNIKLTPNLEVKSVTEPANEIIKADMQKHRENDEILDKILGKDRKISFWRGHVNNPSSPFYIDLTKDLPTAIEIANDIHNAGGFVILPHVFEYRSVNNIEFLNKIYSLGILDGIECVHTKHSKEQTEFLENYCKEKDLLMTGGSDFHSKNYQELGHVSFGEIEDKYCLKKP